MFPLPDGLVRCKSCQEPEGNLDGLTIAIDRCFDEQRRALYVRGLASGRTQTERKPIALDSGFPIKGDGDEKDSSRTKCGKGCGLSVGAGRRNVRDWDIHDERSDCCISLLDSAAMARLGMARFRSSAASPINAPAFHPAPRSKIPV